MDLIARRGDHVIEECPSDELLSAYVDHRLSPAKRAAVEAHLASCTLCRKTVALTVKSQAAVPDPPPLARKDR